MEAALALPVRFGERWQSMATKSVFQLTDWLRRNLRFEFKETRLVDATISTGVIDQAIPGRVRGTFEYASNHTKHIRDNLLAGQTCFRLDSRIECIAYRAAALKETRTKFSASLDSHVRMQPRLPVFRQTSKRDGAFAPRQLPVP
jgi:hypothetical protein